MLWEPRKRLLFLWGGIAAGEGCQRGLADDSGSAVYPHSHTAAHAASRMLGRAARRYGNMENRLLVLLVALRIRGDATGVSAAHADICPALGYGVVGLEKKDGDGAAAAEPIFAR